VFFLFIIIPLLNLKTICRLGDTIHRMQRVSNVAVVITAMFSGHYIPNFQLKVLFM
jgi:hypothetical protein